MKKTHDLIVIGSGPGGYVCAIRAAQLGFKVALVEKQKSLGGTCLNVGCIPSKAWLDFSKNYAKLLRSFGPQGIEAKDVKLNFSKMKKRVEQVVSETRQGVEFLMKKNNIHIVHGLGTFEAPQTVRAQGQTLTAPHIVIATGSSPREVNFPGPGTAITSTEALFLEKLPESVVVVGGGAIGLELGQVFGRLGSRVCVVEATDSLLPGMDRQMSLALKKSLEKDGLSFFLNHSVAEVGHGEVMAQPNGQGEGILLEAQACLVAIGRRPNTQGLGLENIGLALDKTGRIPTDDHLRTPVSNIYAIGDVKAGPMLAHRASEEGVFVAESLAGQKPQLNPQLIPSVVYTWPELAAVGQTEELLKQKSTPYKKGVFPIKALGRARASGETDGLVKVLASKDTDEILGVHMLGPQCSDLIAEAILAMEFRACAEDVARAIHPHPTYSEALKEACLLAFQNKALHL